MSSKENMSEEEHTYLLLGSDERIGYQQLAG